MANNYNAGSVQLCKCLYCLKKFRPANAPFRTTTVYTMQDFDNFTNEEKQEKEPFLEAADPVLGEFWSRFPNSQPKSDYDKRPVLSNTDPRYLKGVYKRDAEGFVNEAIDGEGRSTKVRICPLCHNVLPFEFGKYPVKYIAVVGITSSGKTVYLSQMLKKIKEILARVNYSVVGGYSEIEAFTESREITKGKPLPKSNTPDVFILPLPINVMNNATGKRYTLVFYDIAGENCVNANNMEIYGRFVANADGIIMIVDPKQFTQLFFLPGVNASEQVFSPEKVVEAMYDCFLSANNTGGKSQVPLAATLSKSDLLREGGAFSEDSILFEDIHYEEYDKPGFPYDDFNEVQSELESVFKSKESMQGEIFVNALKQSFKNYAFFAFSALNCRAVRATNSKGEAFSVIDEVPETIRIEESLLWIFHELKLIGKVRRKKQQQDKQQQKKKGLLGWGK